MSATFSQQVLIVEDEPQIREILREILGEHGVACDEAEDGVQGMNLLTSRVYDTVICDISMPRKSGLELLSDVRAKGIDTPFVILTGQGDKEKILQSLRLGALDLLEKPCTEAEILPVVFRALEIGKRRRRIQDILTSEQGTPPDENSIRTLERDMQMVSLLQVVNNKKRKKAS